MTGNFTTWLENDAQAAYKRLGGEIFDYVGQLFDNLEGNLTGEEAFKRVMHAFSDDILTLGDPTLQSEMVKSVKRICIKFGQDAGFSIGQPGGDASV